MTCTVDGCDRNAKCLGLCNKHYQQQRRHQGKVRIRESKIAYDRRYRRAQAILTRNHRGEFAAIMDALEKAERQKRLAAMNRQILAEREAG